jgi:hypothetical protein
MDINTELREIRTGISNARTKKARAQVEYDNAQQRAEEAMTVLRDEFGVKTTAEAAETRERLKKELETRISEVLTSLESAGA